MGRCAQACKGGPFQGTDGQRPANPGEPRAVTSRPWLSLDVGLGGAAPGQGDRRLGDKQVEAMCEHQRV